MTDKPRCRECGDTKNLNDIGICRWRHGCEHRQMTHEARMHRLNNALDRQERMQSEFTFGGVPLSGQNQWGHHWWGIPTMSTEWLDRIMKINPEDFS